MPVIHLDQLYWRPSWVKAPAAEFLARANAAAEETRWIIEGNYSETYSVRLERSQMIVWLDFPHFVYFRRVLFRIMASLGKVRPDSARGCPERIDIEFLKFVWNYDRTSRLKLQQAAINYGEGRIIERLTDSTAVEVFSRRLLSRIGPGALLI